MGFFSSIGKVLAYPIIRPVEQLRLSVTQTRSDLSRLRQIREENEELIRLEREAHTQLVNDPSWNGYKPTQRELNDPSLIKDPYMRFDVLYKMHGWDEESLKQQMVAVRRTKTTSSWMSAVLLLCALWGLFALPVYAVILVCPLLVTGSAVAIASAVKHAIFQAQLQERKLMNAKEVMARPDLIQFLFKY